MKDLVKVMLFNEDRTLCLEIGFFGFSQDAVEDYLTKNVVESKKEWVKKYAGMKYV